MEIKPVTFIFLTVSFLLCACQAQVTRTNDEKDIQEAERFATAFYTHISTLKFEEASELFHPAYIEKDKGLKLVQDVHRFFGEIEQLDIVERQTTVAAKGDKLNKLYVMRCVVQYQRETLDEKITISSVSDTLKIRGYEYSLNYD